MQNKVYSRYLYQILMEYGIVSVPSIGTFSLHHTGASFSQGRTSLQPPETTLSFTADQYDTPSFENLLIESGVDKDDAVMLQELLVKDFSASLSSGLPFELYGFGTIENRQFIEKAHGIFNRYAGLEAIPTTPVPATFQRKNQNGEYIIPKVEKDVPIQIEEKMPKTWYTFPLIIAIIAAGVIVAWLLSNRSTSISDVAVNQPIVQETPKQVDSVMVNAIDTQVVAAQKDTFISGPEIQDITLHKEPKTAVENKPKGTSKSGLKTEKKETGVKVKAVDNSSQPLKNCVIIVGAFKNHKNADRMLKKITGKGYDTFSLSSDGFKRIGISYDCSAKDPDSFKQKIRKEFKVAAWHLHDTI